METVEVVGEQLVRSLLYEAEGTALDFKAKQYPFAGATDADKAELLKDILAFSKSFRRNDAYILIGVKEGTEGRAEIVGETDHLPDAGLQQFVNEKTNRRVTFSYHIVAVGDKQVGVIRIPRQQRPTYLKKGFSADPNRKANGLLANTVYIRLGSSTFVANPDDIAQMAVQDAQADAPVAKMVLNFADPVQRVPIGTHVETHHVLFDFDPSTCPDYTFGGGYDPTGIAALASSHTPNPDYWRVSAQRLQEKNALRPLGFMIRNDGSATATDVTVELPFPTDNIVLVQEHMLTAKPVDRYDRFRLVPETLTEFIGRGAQSRRLDVQNRGDVQVLTLYMMKVQPGETVFLREPVYFCCRWPERELVLDASIRADEFAAPQRAQFSIRSTAQQEKKFWNQMYPMLDDLDDGPEEGEGE